MKKEKIINFKKYEDFKRDLQAGELLETSIIFVDDKRKIYTHGTEFGGSDADWNAVEGEDGFIKNKPFGTEESDLIYTREDVAFTGGTNGDYYLSSTDTVLTCPLVEGKKYKLVLDGDEYIFTCQRGGLGNAYLYLTDGYTYNGWEFYVPNGGLIFFRCDAETGKNCVVGKVDMEEKQPDPISVVEVYDLDVKTLDTSFLPITQETGEDKNKIMSQFAVSVELGKLEKQLFKPWVGTQSEYDRISPKDPNTFYFIKEG